MLLRINLMVTFIIIISCTIQITHGAKKQKSAVLTGISDIKEFKKLLRTKTNVLILFMNSPKESQDIVKVFKSVADSLKGQATMVLMDCSNNDMKKICKKMKAPVDKPYHMKHYKDGEFHKDYDRSGTVSSMTNFMRDPTGDLPWEEDPEATDIVHLQDGEAIIKFLRRGPAAFKRSMIMFYAPWCGFCKTLKPEYIKAAADLKNEALLAAIDVSKPGNSRIRQVYNITGFPTLLFYERGDYRFPYQGENKRDAIVEFMRDPLSQLRKKEREVVADDSWAEQDSNVVHLTGETFDDQIASVDQALVVFYAPWCGHCKKIKPEYMQAAAELKKQNLKGMMGAVDATKEPELASRFSVKGYPTIKYFEKGEFKYDAGHLRDEKSLVEFMKNPREPPPPPPPEKPWAEEPSNVQHLDEYNFKGTLKKIKHALVMFYAPWCGHCKSAKPEITRAADRFADELMVLFGAVDCTVEQALCATYQVRGYPTFKYFSFYDKRIEEYNGGRKEEELVSYMHSMGAPLQQRAQAAAGGFGSNVRLLTDHDFDSYLRANKYVFVMFYASWCEHCVEVKPIFSQLPDKVRDLKVAAIDAAENLEVAEVEKIDKLPAFKLYKNGKMIKDYKDERTIDSFVSFLQKMIAKTEL